MRQLHRPTGGVLRPHCRGAPARCCRHREPQPADMGLAGMQQASVGLGHLSQLEPSADARPDPRRHLRAASSRQLHVSPQSQPPLSHAEPLPSQRSVECLLCGSVEIGTELGESSDLTVLS